MLTIYRDKAPHHLCVCLWARVCVCVRMCVSVNKESTNYCIHLALPNANNLQRQSTTPFVCMCALVCLCVCMCVSVNKESTTYRIHLALPNAKTYRDEGPHHL